MNKPHEGGAWKEVVESKRREQKNRIEDYLVLISGPKIESGEEVPLIQKNVTAISDSNDLVAKIARKETTSEAVVKAYIARAIEAHKLTNCLTEILFCDALQQARELDRFQSKEGKLIGPLHGVPMTLKDQFNVKGYDTTLGYTGRAFKPAQADSVLFETLKKLGAVVIAKTNLPQSILWCETDNPLWGLTTNPIDPKYTPGGSTGGESALLYLQGSTLGWGTDIGGSTRIPAHMTGLYGLKPSSSRLPYFGVPVSTEGQEHVPSSIGPIARNLSTMYHAMKAVISDKPWKTDSRCVPLEWRQPIYDDYGSRKLTIGLLLDDGVVRPHPPITRVIQSVAKALSEAGHEIVPWEPSLHAECIEVMDLFYTVDGGEDIRRDVEAGGEPYVPHVEKLVNRGQAISVYEYWQLNKRKRALQQAYLEKWNYLTSPTTGKNVDVVLMPAMPHAAVPHQTCRWVGYTKVWNILDYSALVLPGGKVEPSDCLASWDHSPRNEIDKWNSGLWTENKATMGALGLPVGVQLVARHLEEEKLLGIGRAVDSLIRGQINGV